MLNILKHSKVCTITNLPIYAIITNYSYTRAVVSSFDDGDLPKLTRVVGMKMYGRRWYTIPVIGGLKVYYSNGEARMHGSIDYGPQEAFYEFRLEPQESIVSIDLRSGSLIDQLTFHTNQNRQFGPYGGDGGEGFIAKPRDGELYPYLAYVKGVLVITEEEPADSSLLTVARLQFVWGGFKSGRSAPIDATPIVVIPVAQSPRGNWNCCVI